MRIKLILRFIVALIFATFAAIFAELIPPIPGTDPFLIKALITLLVGGIGFALFPDISRYTRFISLSLFNVMVRRVTQELLNQLLRIRAPHFPFGQTSPQIGGVALTKPVILDTSAIIDGRVLDIAKSGFISGLVLIPRIVLAELQQVADSKDDLKRQRARKGFETIEELKKVKGVKIEVWDREQGGKTVDDKLLNLTKSLHGKIITTDFNLNRVASVANISVLNINDLANAVKTLALPGESLELKIVHIGKDHKQGVGYLEDGTMIVVADSADDIGKSLKVEVTKSLQIPAGRMVFAKKIS